VTPDPDTINDLEPTWIPFAFPGLPGVGVAFQTRYGGVSRPPYDESNISFDVGDDPAAVAANRRALAEWLGVSWWQECRQVHGREMIFDPEPARVDDTDRPVADGLATCLPGQALVIKTADCQPVLLAHPGPAALRGPKIAVSPAFAGPFSAPGLPGQEITMTGPVVAALHVGWRGSVANMPAAGVAFIKKRYGIAPAELYAAVSPGLGACCAEFVNHRVELGHRFLPYQVRPDYFDLEQVTVDQLMAAGVPPERIEKSGLCTRCGPEFFSFRREGRTGRFGTVVALA
jgi:copper oxidase (laccase) domain-containing protein